MKIQNIIPDTLNTASFLSRLPIGRLAERLGTQINVNFETQSWSFPLAGFLCALPAGLALVVSALIGLNAFICVGLALAILTITTGALHEDGLADVADGIGGGQDAQSKLDIMRDSAIGSYGTLALIFSVVLQWAALASIAAKVGPLGAATALCLIAGISRAAMLWPWQKTDPARQNDGLASALGRPTQTQLKLAGLIALGFLIALGIITWAPINVLIASLLAALAVSEFAKLCQRQIGGHTGDTLGATQQITAVILCAGLALS